MKEQEIRIGNYFIHKRKTIQFEQSDWYRIGECIDFLEDYNPIPLSEEWLIKFRFISNPYADRYELDGFNVEHNAERGYSIFWCDKTGTSLEYVHQLQNFYFALTGTELTLKDNG